MIILYQLQTEVAERLILTNLKSAAEGLFGRPSHKVSHSQIRVWLFPQKSENDHEYEINQSYFESIMRLSLGRLIAQGLISLSEEESAEEGEAFAYSLTEKGHRFVEEIVGVDESG